MSSYAKDWDKFVKNIKLGDEYTKEEIMLSIGLTLATMLDELNKIRKQLEKINGD